MSLSKCVEIALVSNQSILVNTAKFQNIELVEKVLSQYNQSFIVINCNSTMSTEDFFVILVQTPRQNKNKDTESDIEEVIRPETPKKNIRKVITTSHYSHHRVENKIEEKDQNISNQNNLFMIYNIDKLNKRDQQALKEVLIHKQIEINNKSYILSNKITFIATLSEISNISTDVLDEFLIYTESEEVTVNNDFELSQLKRSLLLTNVSLKIIQFIRDIIITFRYQNLVPTYPTSKSFDLIKLASQCVALLNKRDYVTPSDVNYIVPFVLSHRVFKEPKYVENIIKELVNPI